jgi:small subunit ribosomal protein S20
MPNTKSAIKALRQSVKRRARNLATKKAYKQVVKDFRNEVVASSAAGAKEASKMLSLVQKKLDKAAKAGVIKKNKASRLKSRAAKLLAKSSK